MGRQNNEDGKHYNMFVRQGLRLGTLKTVPADNFVVDKDMPPWLILTPAGIVDILMPESTKDIEGLTFIITNLGGAGAITLKSSGDAAFTAAIVLAANESTMVMCTGSSTAALGWVAIGTALAA